VKVGIGFYRVEVRIRELRLRLGFGLSLELKNNSGEDGVRTQSGRHRIPSPLHIRVSYHVRGVQRSGISRVRVRVKVRG
jgi:hypothetical protein